MSKAPTVGRRSHVVESLASAIRRGDLSHGDQLDGENALARQFSVSRGTIRQALDELKRQNLIITRTGIGSFVTFDGVALDQTVGWARALADAGGGVTTEILDITLVDENHPEATRLGTGGPTDGAELHHAVHVRRLRRLPDGTPVSYESSLIPASGSLSELPSTGLLDGSLTATLAAAGLRAAQGTQDVRVVRLDSDDAGFLDQAPGTAYLCTERTSYSIDGRFVEHVVALLDPDHFRLTQTFGDQSQ